LLGRKKNIYNKYTKWGEADKEPEQKSEHKKGSVEHFFNREEVSVAKAALGLDPHLPLSVDSVKAAFIQRAKETHPDSESGGNIEDFRRASEAYEFLLELLEKNYQQTQKSST